MLGGDVVTAILMFVVGLAIIAGMAGLMWWMNHIRHRQIQRRREAWKAAGNVGPCPGDDLGSNPGYSGYSALG